MRRLTFLLSFSLRRRLSTVKCFCVYATIPTFSYLFRKGVAGALTLWPFAHASRVLSNVYRTWRPDNSTFFLQHRSPFGYTYSNMYIYLFSTPKCTFILGSSLSTGWNAQLDFKRSRRWDTQLLNPSEPTGTLLPSTRYYYRWNSEAPTSLCYVHFQNC